MLKESGRTLLMTTASDQLATYEKDIETWRKERSVSLRREDGWLTLVGLFWLHEGENTVGSDPTSDIVLPVDSAPKSVGIIDFHNSDASFRVTCYETVLIDGVPLKSAALRDDE